MAKYTNTMEQKIEPYLRMRNSIFHFFTDTNIQLQINVFFGNTLLCLLSELE